MKKLLFIVLITLFGFQANAQFSAGAWGGLPIGDAGDFATFSLGADLTYLFPVSDAFGVGPTVGVSHSFGDSIDVLGTSVDLEDTTFIPIAAAGRFGVSETFTLGVDLGYGVGIAPDGNDGGFYYSPRVGYSVTDLIEIVLAYRGVSLDGGSWDVVSLGLEFGID